MISVKKLTKVYKTRGRTVVALNEVSFDLPEKGMVFIVGKSGSGKSTLLNMISGLDTFTSGKIIASGNSVGNMSREEKEKYLSSYIGYIFQDYRLIEDFTVRQNVELAQDISDSGEYYQKYLQAVGLYDYESRYPKELSGGQKQRVAIARALVKKPKIILADEPTGNLDQATTKEILDLLRKVSRDTLVLIVSHNMRDADEYADRIIELADGKIISDRSRVSGYTNNFGYYDGYIKLPHHKDLTEDEIGEVLRRGRYAKGIVQNSGGFVPTKNPKPVTKKSKLKNKGMSLRNLVKIFSIFFKRKIFSKVVTVFLAAVILSVFYILQALTLYETNTAMVKAQVNTDAYGVIVQAGTSYYSSNKVTGHLSEGKIAKIAEEYDGNVYKLYSAYQYTNGIMGGGGYVKSMTNLASFYSMISYGTLNTTEEYAKKVLGVDELKVLAGDLYDKDYGMVITDYLADSMMSNCPTAYTSYEDILGLNSFFYEKTYINAIVDTDYENEHTEIMNTLLSLDTTSDAESIFASQEFIDFYSDVSERYGIAFNFCENYESAVKEFHKTQDYMRFSASVRVNSGTKISTSFTVGKNDSLGLEDGEMIVNLGFYNQLFPGNTLTVDDIDNENFKPFKIVIYQNEGDMDATPTIEKTFTVVGLTSRADKTSTGLAYANSATMAEMVDFNIYTYSFYLDDPTEALKIVDLIDDYNLSLYSGKVGNVYYIERCVSVFGNFLKVTEVFILIACAIFLVNFGIKSIRSNIYEIGVIKAMGGVKRDISKIFISQSVVIGIGILGVTYIGMQVGAYIADQVFLSSLHSVLGIQFYGIRAIDFYPEVALFDIAVALLVVIVSSVISTKSIDKLNLISILKAKE